MNEFIFLFVFFFILFHFFFFFFRVWGLGLKKTYKIFQRICISSNIPVQYKLQRRLNWTGFALRMNVTKERRLPPFSKGEYLVVSSFTIVDNGQIFNLMIEHSILFKKSFIFETKNLRCFHHFGSRKEQYLLSLKETKHFIIRRKKGNVCSQEKKY